MFGLMLFLREGTGEAKILIFVLSIFNADDVIQMTHSHWCPMVSSPHDALQHASYIQSLDPSLSGLIMVACRWDFCHLGLKDTVSIDLILKLCDIFCVTLA